MNAERKWTPGPWHFGPMHGWIGMCIMRKPSSEYGPQGTIGDAPIAKVIDGAAHWENSYPVEANARLIAAAPDMYEALRKIKRELAALISDPDAGDTKYHDWPVANIADADCLQVAWEVVCEALDGAAS